MDPVGERTVALVLSDCRVLFWKLIGSHRLVPVSTSEQSIVPLLSPLSHGGGGGGGGGGNVIGSGGSAGCLLHVTSLSDLLGPQSFPGISTRQQSG